MTPIYLILLLCSINLAFCGDFVKFMKKFTNVAHTKEKLNKNAKESSKILSKSSGNNQLADDQKISKNQNQKNEQIQQKISRLMSEIETVQNQINALSIPKESQLYDIQSNQSNNIDGIFESYLINTNQVSKISDNTSLLSKNNDDQSFAQYKMNLEHIKADIEFNNILNANDYDAIVVSIDSCKEILSFDNEHIIQAQSLVTKLQNFKDIISSNFSNLMLTNETINNLKLNHSNQLTEILQEKNALEEKIVQKSKVITEYEDKIIKINNDINLKNNELLNLSNQTADINKSLDDVKTLLQKQDVEYVKSMNVDQEYDNYIASIKELKEIQDKLDNEIQNYEKNKMDFYNIDQQITEMKKQMYYYQDETKIFERNLKEKKAKKQKLNIDQILIQKKNMLCQKHQIKISILNKFN